MIFPEDVRNYIMRGEMPTNTTAEHKIWLRRCKAIQLAKEVLGLMGESIIGMAKFAQDLNFDVELLTSMREKLLAQVEKDHPEFKANAALKIVAEPPSKADTENEKAHFLDSFRKELAACDDPAEITKRCRMLRAWRGHGAIFKS
jgi:hypothetical protein